MQNRDKLQANKVNVEDEFADGSFDSDFEMDSEEIDLNDLGRKCEEDLASEDIKGAEEPMSMDVNNAFNLSRYGVLQPKSVTYSDEVLNQLIQDIDDVFYRLPRSHEVEAALSNELFTVQDVVRYLVSLFAQYGVYVGHGTNNYWEEALEMVQAVIALQPPCDDSILNSRLTRNERELIAKMAIARAKYRIPTPYLTHRAFFAGHQFYIDRRVIIPRSPIAELIEEEFRPFLTRAPERVLDMCTGSGCIAIAIALQFEGECEVDAVDISLDALDVALHNIEAYNLEKVVFPIQSDLFDNLPEGDRYDLIVANPPYVNAEDLAEMPEEYHREPAIALGSGDDGLDCVRRILAQARDHLTDDGILIVEVGNTEENLVETYPNVPFHFIELKRGGSGVFLLTADQLEGWSSVFAEQNISFEITKTEEKEE